MDIQLRQLFQILRSTYYQGEIWLMLLFGAGAFHWGPSSAVGFEHFIDGVNYPLEMHYVHFNSKHGDIATAVASGEEDALAVVALMFEVDVANPSISHLLYEDHWPAYEGNETLIGFL
eukprot:TRINITY_DN7234_c0_g1_i1.p1 TRINITY_DN7234_c0_g1~~TRINITY_DN7234_c0_g1_i1.p1  ORF type:complete len:118 (-),score=13.37 TRINITY_DN7234_c0_g1_i1:11-364(-)